MKTNLFEMAQVDGHGILRLRELPERGRSVRLPLGLAKKIMRVAYDVQEMQVSYARRYWRDPRAWKYGHWDPSVPDLSERRYYLTFAPGRLPVRVGQNPLTGIVWLCDGRVPRKTFPWEDYCLGRPQYAVHLPSGGGPTLGRLRASGLDGEAEGGKVLLQRLGEGQLFEALSFEVHHLPSDPGEEWLKTNNVEAAKRYLATGRLP